MVAISSDNFLARRHNRYGTVQQGVVPCRGTVRSTQRVGRFWRCRELKEEAMSHACPDQGQDTVWTSNVLSAPGHAPNIRSRFHAFTYRSHQMQYRFHFSDSPFWRGGDPEANDGPVTPPFTSEYSLVRAGRTQRRKTLTLGFNHAQCSATVSYAIMR